MALSVQEELQQREADADRLRRQEVESTRHEAELARRRFLQVDPDHRLVAETLNAEWNEKLRRLAEAQDRYERRAASDRTKLDETRRTAILSSPRPRRSGDHDDAIESAGAA